MEKLFRAIRHDEFAVVEALLDKNPALVAAVRKPPPKKDAGQQPLGVALKTGRYRIARLLLDRGADVDFIEDASVDGRQPVVNDAVEAAVVGALSRPETRAESLDLLTLMLRRGADVTAPHPDTRRPVLWWAVFRVQRRRRTALSPEDVVGLTPVFQALVDAGADPDATDEWLWFRSGGKEIASRERTSVRALLAARATHGYEPDRGLLAILDDCAPGPASPAD